MFFPNTFIHSVLSRVVAPIFTPPSPSEYEASTIPENGFRLSVTNAEGGGEAKYDVDDGDESTLSNKGSGDGESDADESDDDESDDDDDPPLLPPCVQRGASSFVNEYVHYSDSDSDEEMCDIVGTKSEY